MEETYDVVVCGTGLIECILSGLLSQEGTFPLTKAKRCCTSIVTLIMEVRELQSILLIFGRSSAINKSQTKS